MRRSCFALLCSAVVLASCHAVLIRVERGGSAGLFHQGTPKPRTFFDGHAIPFPAAPFVNCLDVLEPTMPAATCSIPAGRDPDSISKQRFWRSFVGYTRDQVVHEQADDTPPAWLRRARFDAQLALMATLREIYGRKGSPDQLWLKLEVVVESVPSVGYSMLEHSYANLRVDGVWVWDKDFRTWKRQTETPEAFFARLGLPDDADRDRRAQSVVFLRANDPAARPQMGSLLRAAGTPRLRTLARDFMFTAGERFELYRDMNLAQPAISFMHISDAQIREPNAKLGGQQVSDKLDPLIPSFAHDYEQELYSAFIYEAFIQTTNAEVAAAQCDRDQLDARAGTSKLSFEQCKARAKRCGRDPSHCTPSGAWLFPDVLVRGGNGDARDRNYRIPPSFMVHTGDSIDAGLESEFTEFLTRSDDLRIPWYSSIGNHDVLGFGNLDLRVDEGETFSCTPTRRMIREYHLRRPRGNGDDVEYAAEQNPDAKAFALVPAVIDRVCLETDVGNDRLLALSTNGKSPIQLYIDAHCRGASATSQECRRHELPPAVGRESPNEYAFQWSYEPATGALQVLSHRSRKNGLDIVNVIGREDAVGWYAFPVSTVHGALDRRIWSIVLNTTTVSGAFGQMDKEQLEWLERMLPGPIGTPDTHPIKRRDLVMIFAHHPLWGIENPAERHALKDVLLRAGNVIAYFAGHTHAPQLRAVGCVEKLDPGSERGKRSPICTDANYDRRRFWEIVAPATLAFPQQARHVTLKLIPNSDLAYIEVLSFEPHLRANQQSFVSVAMRGAERDQCDQHPEDCQNGRPRMPERQLTYPRLFFRLP